MNVHLLLALALISVKSTDPQMRQLEIPILIDADETDSVNMSPIMTGEESRVVVAGSEMQRLRARLAAMTNHNFHDWYPTMMLSLMVVADLAVLTWYLVTNA